MDQKLAAAHDSGQSQHWLTVGSILVLLLASAFHFYRGAPSDGAVYLVLGLVLIIAERKPSQGGLPGPKEHIVGRAHRWWLVVLLPALATASAFAPIGGWLVFLLLGVGLVLMVLGWQNPTHTAQLLLRDPVGSHRRRATAIGLCVVVLFLCFWELWMYFTEHLNPSLENSYPPLTDLLEPAFQSTGTRWLLTLLWMTGCALLIAPRTPKVEGKRT